MLLMMDVALHTSDSTRNSTRDGHQLGRTPHSTNTKRITIGSAILRRASRLSAPHAQCAPRHTYSDTCRNVPINVLTLTNGNSLSYCQRNHVYTDVTLPLPGCMRSLRSNDCRILRSLHHTLRVHQQAPVDTGQYARWVLETGLHGQHLLQEHKPTGDGDATPFP